MKAEPVKLLHQAHSLRDLYNAIQRLTDCLEAFLDISELVADFKGDILGEGGDFARKLSFVSNHRLSCIPIQQTSPHCH